MVLLYSQYIDNLYHTISVPEPVDFQGHCTVVVWPPPEVPNGITHYELRFTRGSTVLSTPSTEADELFYVVRLSGDTENVMVQVR